MMKQKVKQKQTKLTNNKRKKNSKTTIFIRISKIEDLRYLMIVQIWRN